MSEQRPSSISGIELPSSNSGRVSKNASPTRSVRKLSNADQESSRNMNANASPTRPSNATGSVLSAAVVQRALSTTKTTPVNNDTSSDTNRDKRQRSGPSTLHWPTSPRLKSPPPPPTSFRAVTGRRIENDYNQSNTSMRRLAPVSNVEMGAMMQVPQDMSKESVTNQPPLRATSRGIGVQGAGLETVAESSLPSTPLMGPVPKDSDDPQVQSSSLDHDSDSTIEANKPKDSQNNPSSETTTKPVNEKPETASSSRATSTSRPPGNLAKRSFTSLTGKSKSAVEPLRTMTVETEMVSSTPQMITDRGRDGGSVRTKPSTETIRPRKEKKRPPRKAPSLHAGMNSSKADIFEAKVASAVDEADSSDSDETFVYESNPPESNHRRHHSRTPSANSLASQVDHYGARGKHGVRNNSTIIGGKKSMKFSNSIHGNQLDAESAGDGRGSTRTTSSTPRPHHIGRHGRNAPTSIIDADSPFTQPNRLHSPRTPTARNSRPSSPRTSNGRLHMPRKSVTGGYDVYEDGADDERAPLMSSVRVNRGRYGRRPNSSHFRPMHFSEEEEPGCWPRLSGCFFLGVMMTLICIGVVVFVVVLNRPLIDIEVIRIQNVLASEQELMLDVKVRATNPNLFTITVNELDVNIFAESPYVGTAAEWKSNSLTKRLSFTQRRQQLNLEKRAFWFPPFGSHDGVDEGTDPIDEDPEPGSQKMLLGRIFDFDSPLVFDPSPVRRNSASSVGEIRLTKPGNKTEVGGSARWEHVLQHPFDLIVRGVIRYQLPLSSNTRSAKIGSRVKVNSGGDSDDIPGDNDDVPGDNDNTTTASL